MAESRTGETRLYSQQTTSSWSSVVGPDSAIIGQTETGPGVVIAHEESAYRAAWYTGFVEYDTGAEAERAVYNAVVWAAGLTP